MIIKTNIDVKDIKIPMTTTTFKKKLESDALSKQNLLKINSIDCSESIETLDMNIDETYIIQKGDTLSSIAKAYNTDYTTLAEYNNIPYPYEILPDQEIKIPMKDSSPVLTSSNKKSQTATKLTQNKINETIFEDQNINKIYAFFHSKGVSEIAICAILGNLQYETANTFNSACNWERLHSSDPDYFDNEYYDQQGNLIYTEADLRSLTFSEAKEKITGLIPKYGGIGFLQWTGGKFDGNKWVPAGNGADRKAQYLNWCNENKCAWDHLDSQLEYLWIEYESWGNRDYFESMLNVREAATYFCNNYEFPGDNSASIRSDYAEKYLNKVSAKI